MFQKVSDTISHYFVENVSEEVGTASIWEGHKSVVRGKLIYQGALLKWECTSDLQILLSKLRKAEIGQKRRPTPEALTLL